MGEVIAMQRDRKVKVTDALEEILNYMRQLEGQNETLRAENERLKESDPYTKGFDKLPDVLTAQDVAKYLGVSRYRAYEYLKISPEHGGIKSFELGRSVRCEKADLADWLKKRKEDKAHGVRRWAREK